MNAIPASSTFCANSWFSDRNPYLTHHQLQSGWSHSPRVDHIYSMFQSDPNNIILSQIRPNRSQPLPNQITLITLVSMSSHSVLEGVDGDGGHGEFVCGTEDTDGDFTSVGDEDFLEWTCMAGLFAAESLDASELSEVVRAREGELTYWREFLGCQGCWDRRYRYRGGRPMPRSDYG